MPKITHKSYKVQNPSGKFLLGCFTQSSTSTKSTCHKKRHSAVREGTGISSRKIRDGKKYGRRKNPKTRDFTGDGTGAIREVRRRSTNKFITKCHGPMCVWQFGHLLHFNRLRWRVEKADEKYHFENF